jgi:hypothetical protein
MSSQPLHEPPNISLRRLELCSRENAHRVANRLFEHKRRPVSVIRTGNPMKPFHVTDEETHGDHVEVELRA